MNYKFLAKEELIKFFEETDLSVGEIIRTITQEKFTGVNIPNRSQLTDVSDQKWYETFEKAFDYERE